MTRKIHIGVGTDRNLFVEITDDAAEELIARGILYPCGGEEEGEPHDLHISPDSGISASIMTMILGIAVAQNKTFRIGDATMRHVFEPAGLRNMSDMQAVMDEVERVLSAYEKSNDDRLKTPTGMVSITTNGTTRLIPEDEPVFLLRAQDQFAADVVKIWAGMARSGGAGAAISDEAYRHAEKMEAWPVKGLPDLPGDHVLIDKHLPHSDGISVAVIGEAGALEDDTYHVVLTRDLHGDITSAFVVFTKESADKFAAMLQRSVGSEATVIVTEAMSL